MSEETPELELPSIVVGENSYVSLAEAKAIARTRLFAAHWNAASDTTRIQALVTATVLLDRMVWEGRPLAPTQSLSWPRVADRCPPGYPITTEIPAAIITATVELAVYLLKQGDFTGAPVMQRMLGDSMVTYYPTIADELPKHVRRLIEPHLRATSANVAEVSF